uniref:Uncharacterized protein n=1 Tax=Glossina pallidipes TaxID=7398 RepID=A0A1B0AGT9_GLOPL
MFLKVTTISLKYYQQLEEHGANDLLKHEYNSLLAARKDAQLYFHGFLFLITLELSAVQQLFLRSQER